MTVDYLLPYEELAEETHSFSQTLTFLVDHGLSPRVAEALLLNPNLLENDLYSLVTRLPNVDLARAARILRRFCNERDDVTSRQQNSQNRNPDPNQTSSTNSRLEPLTEKAQRLFRLLDEFTKKFAPYVEDAIRLNNQPENTTDQMARVDELRERLLQMVNPAEALIRSASQMAEHARLEELDRIELRLRLAEFESVFRIIRNAIGA